MNTTIRETAFIGIAIITALLIASNVYLLIPIGEYLIQQYSFSNKELSVCSSVFSICYAGGFLFWGLLANKFGSKPVLLAGLSVLTAVTALCAVYMNRSNFVIFRALQGISAASFAPAIVALISSLLPDSKKVVSIGILSSTFLISGITGQMLAIYFIETYTLSVLFFVLAAAYSLCFIFLYLSLPCSPAQSQQGTFIDHCKAFPRSLGNKKLVPYFLVTVTLLLSFVGVYTTLHTILAGSSLVTPENMQKMRLFGIPGMAVSPFSSILSKRFGVKITIIFSLLLSCTAAVLLVFVFSLSFGILVVCTIIFNCGIALVCPLIVSKIGSISEKNKNIAVSLYTFILFIGASLGSFLSIKLSSFVPGPKIMLLYAFFLLFSFFIIVFFTKEKTINSRAG